MQLLQRHLGRIIRFITGHNFLNRHNFLLNNPNTLDNFCRLCEMEPETSSHVICGCPCLHSYRVEAFQEHFLDIKRPTWTPQQLIKFSNLDLIKALEVDEDLLAEDLGSQAPTNSDLSLSYTASDESMDGCSLPQDSMRGR